MSENDYPQADHQVNHSNPSLANPEQPLANVVRKKLMGYVGFANLPTKSIVNQSARDSISPSWLLVKVAWENRLS